MAVVSNQDLCHDVELMRRVGAGDTGAFGAIYDRHARSVFGLALRMLHERCAAEDVAQEAFTALWRSRHTYRAERGGARAWLLTITRNRAIDAIRRARTHPSMALEAVRDPEAVERTDEEAFLRIEAIAIGVALHSLPAAQRQVVELSFFEGLTQSEIAAGLGVPLGTVKGRMRLALRKLAAELAEQPVSLARVSGSSTRSAMPTPTADRGRPAAEMPSSIGLDSTDAARRAAATGPRSRCR